VNRILERLVFDSRLFLEVFMGKRIRLSLAAVVFCSLLFTAQSNISSAEPASANADLTPEKLIAEHIKSIGEPTTLSSVNSRAFLGSTDVKFVQGMTGSIKGGMSTFVSEGNKLGIVLKYGSIDYPQEYFAYNGDNVSVGYISPGQRSPLADFLFRFNGVMKKGFIGGTLSLSWPLLDADGIQYKLKYKKVKVKDRELYPEDRELYQLEWPMNVLGNIRIKMYFEPDTFHHVRTDYVVRVQEDYSVRSQGAVLGQLGEVIDEEVGTVGRSSIMDRNIVPESIYTLIERFEDYKKVSGMTLPHKYSIEYTLEGQGHSFIGHWTINASKWLFNRTYDEMLFEAQK
jgi:hypothetical protein